MTYAPIALFAYKRPDHLKRVLQALSANAETEMSELYVFCDGAKNQKDDEAVEQVRNMARGVRGFAALHVIESAENLGVSKSIVKGVSLLCAEHGKAIVLEDDIVTSPYFLRFMNDALNTFEGDEEVASIGAYMFPVQNPLPETFFFTVPDCWGWAVWNRSWQHYESDGKKLLEEIAARSLERDFDLDGAYPYLKMLRDQTLGLNDSWAVRWYAKVFLDRKLCFYPGLSLTCNIGMDGSGRHSGDTESYDNVIASRPIPVKYLPFVEDCAAKQAIANYLREAAKHSWRARLSSKVRGVRSLLRLSQ